MSVLGSVGSLILVRWDLASHGKGVRCGTGVCQFRFEAMWLTHESFVDFLSCCWLEQDDLAKMLEDTQSALMDWNREKFGLIEKEKRVLVASLNGIQKSPRYHTSLFLHALERDIQRELDVLLRREEIKWFQKARTEWITKGDRNCRYYHLKATMRKRRNSILMLKNDGGEWIEDEMALKSLVTEYFQKLYQDEGVNASWISTMT
ncbi:hypothetical protein QN277_018824 [Acacia crassicarpa]|uniref:Uncharacterized protein n=1 Tax=Acacia crassicarpa TaxID=499986 RepID=A0AAE1JRD8_9FABA|nr:hypothetical protein QN277_018824 [Acacia crassicarpa]